jgi:hypothetical protein
VVDSGGLEIPSRSSAPKQINTLAYGPVPRFSLIWAVLAAKCATKCATRRIVCNGLMGPMASRRVIDIPIIYVL